MIDNNSDSGNICNSSNKNHGNTVIRIVIIVITITEVITIIIVLVIITEIVIVAMIIMMIIAKCHVGIYLNNNVCNYSGIHITSSCR